MTSGAHGWLLLRHAATAGSTGCFVGCSDRPIEPVDDDELARLVQAVGHVDVVVVTPLRRTKETLDLLVQAGMRPPSRLVIGERLVEQSFGRWEEQAYDLLAAADPAYWRFWDDPAGNEPPGGESYRAVFDRTLAAHRALADSLEGQVLHIGHAGPIRALLAWQAGQDPRDALTRHVAPLSLHRMQGGETVRTSSPGMEVRLHARATCRSSRTSDPGAT
ncbi:MAG TPA: histidine phosphatase family protein [Geminicoccus sp.]|uniref:histidine phosphatase family protein n=1 Tax=Geminicoccus sp. TaxID=2024832 RepID=UPI002E2FD13C|nr:histidine phosphatase family protein [Geminicoccus sp.]HEX2525067.1 histidine phosphatase family protein [Geminicoccus sp.]